jgi:hypothetical protein
VNDDDSTHTARDAQRAALLASTAVIAGFVLYWAIQIEAVRESLAIAYGP